jgi:hypothetical protein
VRPVLIAHLTHEDNIEAAKLDIAQAQQHEAGPPARTNLSLGTK